MLAICDARLAHGFQNCIYRLDEGGFLEANIVRDCDHAALGDPGHGTNKLRETAPVGVESCGEADFLIPRTLREKLLCAIKTISTGDMMETDYAVADFPFFNARTDG